MLKITINKLKIGKRVLLTSKEFVLSRGLTCLAGPNGSGKSFLLDVICGDYKTRGVIVQISKRNISSLNSYQRFKMGVRRLHQFPVLNENTTIDEITTDISKLITEAHLQNEIFRLINTHIPTKNRKFGELSYGQKRVLEFCHAVCSGTYLLLDEPFAGLNKLISNDLYLFLKRIAINKTVLLIDHSHGYHDESSRIELYSVKESDLSVQSDYQERLNDVFKCLPAFSSTNQFWWKVKDFVINEEQKLKDVSITLNSGEAIYLIGPNGSGKTTFLYELGKFGIFEGSKNEIDCNIDRNQIFCSPQPPKIIAETSLLENISLMIGKGKKPDKSIMKSIILFLKAIGISEGQFNLTAEMLSGGEQTIISLTCAIASNSRLIFLDEPFESLTNSMLQIAKELISRYLSIGGCLIIATHKLPFDVNLNRHLIIDLTEPLANRHIQALIHLKNENK